MALNDVADVADFLTNHQTMTIKPNPRPGFRSRGCERTNQKIDFFGLQRVLLVSKKIIRVSE